MANLKSAKKRAKTNVKRKMKNSARKSEIKTITKKVISSLEKKELDVARELLKETISKIARAKGKGVLKKNTASRKISRISKKVVVAEKQLT